MHIAACLPCSDRLARRVVLRMAGMFLAAWIAWSPPRVAAAPDGGAPTQPALTLRRGMCIDRQVRKMPPEPGMTIHADDIRLIRRMGFGFVKILINPAVLESRGNVDDGVDARGIAYFEQVVDLAARENLPAVLCIHAEDDYKRTVLGNAKRFEDFFALVQALSRHMARRWSHRQVALQLMTEPYGTSDDPRAWNHWDRLQRRLWQAVRKEMPRHTLILSGDTFGSVEGLYSIQPVDDDNVMYCFTFYEPFLFTFQGGNWRSDIVPGLHRVPYPVSDATAGELPRLLQSAPAAWQATAKAQLERYARERWNREALAARIDKAAAWRRLHSGRPVLWCAEFGCYHQAAKPEDRRRYLGDMRSVLEERDIGWAYWSYNETFTVMGPGRTAFGPAGAQTPDREVLEVLLPDMVSAQNRR
jgi:endoglucanase